MNPYRAALLWLSVIALVAAGIVLVVGEMVTSRYPYPEGTPFLAWAIALGSVGLLGILLWLVVAALTWKPGDVAGVSIRELGDAWRKGVSDR